MSQAISALSVGTEVNLIEKIGSTKKLVPFIIIATGSGNPYGSDKVLLLRKRYTSSNKFGSTPLYDGSTIDSWLVNSYIPRFDDATKNCIALSTIKCYNISTSEQYTLARKAFLLSVKEAGGSDANDPSTAISYLTQSRRVAYDDTGVSSTAASWWLRSPYSSSYAWFVGANGTLSSISVTNSYASRPALNIIGTTLVSSVANQDGSYNLLPNVGITAGEENTGASDPVVDEVTFLQQYRTAGDYTFTYADDAWGIEGDENTYSASDLETTFGITYTGTAAASDTITVSIVNPNKKLEYTCLVGGTDKRPKEALLEVEYTCQGDDITFYMCNNYKDTTPTWEEVTLGQSHAFANSTHAGATISVGSGSTGVDTAIVDKPTFLQTYNVAGTYTFTFNGTNWIIGGNVADLTALGITVTGTPAENDTVSVVLDQWFVGVKVVAESENTITSYEPMIKMITD